MKPHIMLIIGMFLLAGCGDAQGGGGFSFGSKEKPKDRGTIEYRQGHQGVIPTFGDTKTKFVISPDKEEEVFFPIEVANMGAFPPQGKDLVGSLWLSGFDPRVIVFPPDEDSTPLGASEYLYGKNPFSDEGGKDVFEFKGKLRGAALTNPSVSLYEPVMLANVCYDYETFASPTVCVDADPLNLEGGDKPCKMEDITLKDQGAPVAVVRVEQQLVSDEYRYNIFVINLGKGEIFESHDKCREGVPNIGFERIEALVTMGRDNFVTLDCNSFGGPADRGKIRLIDGDGSMRCTVPKGMIEQFTPYVTPLAITLKYTYRESTSLPLSIQVVE